MQLDQSVVEANGRLMAGMLTVGVLVVLLIPHASPAWADSMINPDYDHKYDKHVVVSQQGFTHPGILHSRAELNLIRDMVQQGRQPWARTFDAFRRDPYSLLTYKMTGPEADIGSVPAGYKLITDGGAAYNLAIMWYVTGDAAYSKKAIEILNAWSATATTNATDRIRHGVAALRLMAAAEILRYTPSSGWSDEEVERFKTFARRFPPAIDINNGFMNQGGYAAMGSMAVAVFLDDVPYYQRIINRITVGDNPDPLRDIAIARQIYPTGQVSEMGRDQPHASADVSTLAMMAQTMFIQGPALSGGIDLFDYLDRRLLRGSEYYTRFNLGYDVEWSALNAAGAEKGMYAKVSYSSRGRAVAYDLIYNHYKYVKGVPDSQLIYTKTIRGLVAEHIVTDFPGYGGLLFTHAGAQEPTPPLGPPQRVEVASVDPRFGRFSAADYVDIAPGSYTEYFTDADGTRPYVSGAHHNDWVKYDNFDFGPTPVDRFYISSGNNSSVGNKIDIHLDSLTGPVIGTVEMPGTGWYSQFRTGVAKLSRPMSGKQTIVIKQYGSNNVYKLEGALEWLKVARASAHFPNSAVINDGTEGTKTADNADNAKALAFTDGAWIAYKDMDFDNGSLTLSLRAATTGKGELQLHHGSSTGPLLASYSLPDTGGVWQNISIPHVRESIYGRQDIAIVYRGTGNLLLDTFQYGSGIPPFPEVDGADYYAVYKGQASRATASDRTTYADITAGSTLAFQPFRPSKDTRYLAIRVASRGGGTIAVIANDVTAAPFATITVPDTGGQWSRLRCDISATKPKNDGLIFMSFDSAMHLDCYQFDPPNFVEGITPVPPAHP
ncbi:MAG: carbohydrate-binding protein [Burkholderiales bacterium]|nr:carbohydrate-binding protein [Phycisphaerae bacterium]